jgi:hypothetical protein
MFLKLAGKFAEGHQSVVEARQKYSPPWLEPRSVECIEPPRTKNQLRAGYVSRGENIVIVKPSRSIPPVIIDSFPKFRQSGIVIGYLIQNLVDQAEINREIVSIRFLP